MSGNKLSGLRRRKKTPIVKHVPSGAFEQRLQSRLAAAERLIASLRKKVRDTEAERRTLYHSLKKTEGELLIKSLPKKSDVASMIFELNPESDADDHDTRDNLETELRALLGIS